MTSMFESLRPAPPDAILGLAEAFQADSNPAKINLAVGVYKDDQGRTPVLECVKQAERRLVEQETTKTYLGIAGLPEYLQGARQLLLADAVDAARVAMVQTPGGTGGLRVLADLLSAHAASATVWISNPTWENHVSIFSASGLQTQLYRYLDASRTGLDFAAMLEDLRSKPRPGDVVLLHACCHNPSGVDLSADQWEQLAAVLAERQLVPMVDFAYQGFGSGLEEDAAGLRRLLASCPEVLLASSFSKNLALYSERVGTAAVVAAEPDRALAVLSQMKRVVRANYSNPPRHGAAVTATVMADAELTRRWHDELAAMRQRVSRMRQALVDGLAAAGAPRDFGFLLDQHGMFSYTGLTPMQCDELRTRWSIYIVASGRINVAGVNEANLGRLCEAIVDVLG